MTHFPPPDDDRAGLAPGSGGSLPPTAPSAAPTIAGPTSPSTPPGRPAASPPSRKRFLGLIAALALVIGPAIAGYAVGQSNGSSASGGAAITLPDSNAPVLGGPSSGTQPNGSSNGSSNGSGSNATSSLDLAAIRDKLDDSVLNINTTLGDDEGAAAGTGILISANGLALTNNHVIKDSTAIQVEISATGKTFPATVLGYSILDDVAVIQLQGASNLKPAELGTSEGLAIGDVVVALGNAGGRGGSPTTVAGAITALDQQITASESDGSNAQVLSDLIQVNANIQSGDSGGPLVDATGAVIGMNAAASRRNGLGGFPSSGGQNEGYAIPIDKALAIAKKITSKEGGPNIHVGGNRATIGVSVSDDSALTTRGGPLGGNRAGTGARVADQNGILEGSGADKAGITNGSTITAIDGDPVTSASDLMLQMVPYQPGDKVEVTWIDPSGTTHRATVTLGSGPPA
jgi:S1-C subfamily serine protease